jgi:hypothetical protein
MPTGDPGTIAVTSTLLSSEQVREADAAAVEWVNTSRGQRAVLGSAPDVLSCKSRPTGP